MFCPWGNTKEKRGKHNGKGFVGSVALFVRALSADLLEFRQKIPTKRPAPVCAAGLVALNSEECGQAAEWLKWSSEPGGRVSVICLDIAKMKESRRFSIPHFSHPANPCPTSENKISVGIPGGWRLLQAIC